MTALLLLVAVSGLTLAFGGAAADGKVDIRRSPTASAAASAGGSVAVRLRLAQAGSVGGTLGKPDQSLSGDRPKGPPAATAPSQGGAKSGARTNAPELTAASLRGHWRVKTTCYGGADTLSFIIRDTSRLEFTGDYEPGGGRIVSGAVSGNQVRLVTSSVFTVTWTGTVSRSDVGMQMEGSYTPGAGSDCRFTARKD
jgi:hypothetical protein